MRGWLRQLRKDRGLTQREVAARLGICQSYYGYIETRGRQKKIDLPLLAKIAGVFQVPWWTSRPARRRTWKRSRGNAHERDGGPFRGGKYQYIPMPVQ